MQNNKKYGLLLHNHQLNLKIGDIWRVITNIHGAIQAIALALLVIFFLVGMIKTCGSVAELKKPEHAFKMFIRFAISKIIITHGLELLTSLFSIIQGTISTIINAAGMGSASSMSLPQEIVTAVESCGFFESIPLWAVTLIRRTCCNCFKFYYDFVSIFKVL